MSDALKMAAESIETTRAVAAKPTRNGRRAGNYALDLIRET
jgi:hypothetical protein